MVKLCIDCKERLLEGYLQPCLRCMDEYKKSGKKIEFVLHPELQRSPK